MRFFVRALVVIMLVILLRNCFFTVDASEYAYVTVLGQHTATYDGSGDGAGLHVGWPWPFQIVQRLDRRLQEIDLAPTEHLTPDAEGKTIDKTLTVEAFVVWRITDRKGVDLFVRRIGTLDRARAILTSRIISQLGSSLGQMKMDDIINTEPGRVDRELDAWQKKFLGLLQKDIATEYGIELVDIRLRRFNYQGEVRRAIFDRIMSERKKKATEYSTEGELQAKNIVSLAEEKARNLLAEARFEEERLKGQADTEAMVIRNQAYSQDAEFYSFLKQMEKLGSILSDNKTVLLMSTHRPLFDLLFNPPKALPEKK